MALWRKACGCAGGSCGGQRSPDPSPWPHGTGGHRRRADPGLSQPSPRGLSPPPLSPTRCTTEPHAHCKAYGERSLPSALWSPLANTFQTRGQKRLRQLPLQASATCVINIQHNKAHQPGTLRNVGFVPLMYHVYGAFSFLLPIFIQVYEDYF